MAAPAACPFTLALDSGRVATIITVTCPAGVANLYVWRVGPSGRVSGVRAAYPRVYSPVTVAGTVVVFRDFEVPLAVPLTYYTQGADAAGNRGPITSHGYQTPDDDPNANDWLVDLVRSANSYTVQVESLVQFDYAPSQTVHHVLSRRTPVITSDITGTPTFELIFTTDDFPEDRDHVRDALGTGSPVLLRTTPDRGVGNLFLQSTGWTEERPSPYAYEQTRRYTVQCQQVDRPDPSLFAPVPPVDYADVKLNYTTYTNLTTLGGSYDQVLYDYPAANAAGTLVSVWPLPDA